MTGRERILATIKGRETDHLALMPITMMFAARQIGVPYREYATDYRVLAEAQVRTAAAFGFDYVSTISDPAREAADLGAAIEWFPDQPPAIVESRALLAGKAVLAALKPPDPLSGGRMHDRVNGVALLKERAGRNLAIEGWVEGPCAMAADLRGINALMLDFFDDPGFVRDLFEFATGMALVFARAQVDAGADLIGVGDAAASLVGPALYDEFVWPYEQKLVDGLHAMGTRVRLHICGRTRRIYSGIGKLGAEIVDLDWLAPVGEARERMGASQVLLGNVDPVAVLRNGTPECVTEVVAACHRAAGARYVVSAGCEVVRDTPVENLRALCGYARGHRAEQFD
jgi:MtaA/CmuA family methyltransferase